MSDNGFEDMASHFGKLSQVDPKKISEESLQEAAEFYMSKLIPLIPVSKRNGKHAKNMASVVADDEGFKVVFEDDAFYWRFLDKGTTKIKALNFKEKTWQQNKGKIETIMTKKLLKELE